MFGVKNYKNISRVSFLLPAIIFLAFIGIFPFLYQIFITFTNYRLINPDYSFVGFENYKNILFNERFYHSLILWLVYTVIAVSIELIIGFTMSLCIEKVTINKSRLLVPILIMPLVLSPVVIGSLFRMMLSSEFGVIIYFLKKIGLNIGVSPTASPALAIPTIAIVDAWQWAPFVFIITYAGLKSIPKEVVESAKVDGVNYIGIVTRIYLPLIRTEIIIAILFLIFRCLKLFDIVFSLTSGGPGISSEVVNYYIYHKAFQSIETNHAAVMGFLLLIIGLVLTNIFTKSIYKEIEKEE